MGNTNITLQKRSLSLPFESDNMSDIEMESKNLESKTKVRSSGESGIEIVEEFLMYLSKDRRWYSINELSEKFKLEGNKIKEIGDFFASYDFVDVKGDIEYIRIDPEIRKLYLKS